MPIDIMAKLFRLSSISKADVTNALYSINDAETINKMMQYLWDKRNLWNIPVVPGAKKEKSLITEEDWKYLTSLAASRCKQLGGEFIDPTSTWSF